MVIRPSDTGSFVATSQTGQFYASTNPSGYITSSSLTNYATQSYVNSASGVLRGDITILQAATGGYYSSSNPSGFINASQTGVLTGSFYPLSGNPSDYVTGSVVRPNQTGAFLTSADLSSYATTGYVNSASGVIRSDLSSLQTATGLLYPRNNPSGYITGIDASSFVTTGQTGDYANTFYPKASNPSGYVTGNVVRPTETGAFLTSFQITGAGTVSSYVSGAFVVMSGAAGVGGITQSEADARYYPLVTNPSGYITGSVIRPADTGSFVTTTQTGALTGQFYPLSTNPSSYVTGSVVRPNETGNFILTSQTGQFYASSNPSGYITGFNSGSYVLAAQTGSLTGAFYPLGSNPSGYVTGLVVRPTDTGSFVTTSQTGVFYPTSNPSGYIDSGSLSTYATQAYVNSASGVIRTDISLLQAGTGSYYLSSNPSGFVTGSVVRSTETGAFLVTGAVSGVGSISVSTSGNKLLISGSSSSSTQTQSPRILGCVFDGGGSVLETGSKAYIIVSQSGTIYKYTALADITGSAVVDVYKNTYANYPPTSSSSIASGFKPTISTGIKTQSGVLTGWSSVTFSSGDVFGINLDSCSGITRLTFELEYQP